MQRKNTPSGKRTTSEKDTPANALPGLGRRIPSPPATRRVPSVRDLKRPEVKRTQPAMPRVVPLGVLPLSRPPPGNHVELALRESSSPPRAEVTPNIGWPGSMPAGWSRRPPVSKGVELARIADVLAGETVMGRFRIEIPLGRGSTGIVFRAHDLPNNMKVAIKFLDPELSRDPAVVERFRSEALTPSRIGTEHVVEVFEADVCPELVPIARPLEPMSPPIPYLVMELLEGKDLRQYLHERGALAPEEVGGYLEQVAATIDRAHELGIVHRDLKPANLFLSRRPDGAPMIKVLDFGIAQLADASAARGLGGGLFGTPWYMAPEQAMGGFATAASDRWALALVAFRLLTGESYWAPCPIPELLGQIMEGPQVPPSWVVRERGLLPHKKLGVAFDAWFMRACHVDPLQRFSSVCEQVAFMRAVLRNEEG